MKIGLPPQDDNPADRDVHFLDDLRRVDAFLSDQASGDPVRSPLSELVVIVLGTNAVGTLAAPGAGSRRFSRRAPVGPSLQPGTGGQRASGCQKLSSRQDRHIAPLSRHWLWTAAMLTR